MDTGASLSLDDQVFVQRWVKGAEFSDLSDMPAMATPGFRNEEMSCRQRYFGERIDTCGEVLVRLLRACNTATHTRRLAGYEAAHLSKVFGQHFRPMPK